MQLEHEQMSRQNQYRISVISRLGHLQQLDGKDITEVCQSTPPAHGTNQSSKICMHVYTPDRMWNDQSHNIVNSFLTMQCSFSLLKAMSPPPELVPHM